MNSHLVQPAGNKNTHIHPAAKTTVIVKGPNPFGSGPQHLGVNEGKDIADAPVNPFSLCPADSLRGPLARPEEGFLRDQEQVQEVDPPGGPVGPRGGRRLRRVQKV